MILDFHETFGLIEFHRVSTENGRIKEDNRKRVLRAEKLEIAISIYL